MKIHRYGCSVFCCVPFRVSWKQPGQWESPTPEETRKGLAADVQHSQAAPVPHALSNEGQCMRPWVFPECSCVINAVHSLF